MGVGVGNADKGRNGSGGQVGVQRSNEWECGGVVGGRDNEVVGGD
jgi:hypothetical protein